MIDLYCERLDAGFWAEPINALTNISFIIAGLSVFWKLRKAQVSTRESFTLNIILFVIGIGSFLFHTFANFWSQMADVIPIGIFQFYYIWIYSRKFMKLTARNAVIFIATFLILSLAAISQQHLLNGSINYVPTLIFLIIMGVYHFKNATSYRSYVLYSAVSFFMALLFRTIDIAACDSFPLGTHFLWHSFNGLTLYLLVMAFTMNKRK